MARTQAAAEYVGVALTELFQGIGDGVTSAGSFVGSHPIPAVGVFLALLLLLGRRRR